MTEKNARRTYRRERLTIRFRDFFAIIFLVTLVAGEILVWVFLGGFNLIWMLTGVPLIVAAATTIAVFVLRRQFTVDLSPRGIRCCDFWGKYQTVAWERIQAATVWHLLGLPYLRLRTSSGGRPLWMTLRIDQQDDLVPVLRDYLPDDHPMLRALTAFE